MGLSDKKEARFKDVDWTIKPGIAYDLLTELEMKQTNVFHNQTWLNAYAHSIALNNKNDVFTIIGRRDSVLVFWLPVEKFLLSGITTIGAYAQDTSDKNNNSGSKEFAAQLSMVLEKIPFLELIPDIDLVLIRNIEIPIRSAQLIPTNWGYEGYKSYQVSLEHYNCDPAENALGIKLNKSQKKKLKGLQRFGNVRIVSAIGSEREKLFEVLIKSKREQLSYLGSANRFKDPKFIQFLEQVFVKSDDENFKLFGLLIEEKVVAICAVIAANKEWLLYQTAYVDGPEKCFSPGKLLLLSVIRRAKDAQVKIFDMSIGDERYKELLSDSNNQMAYFKQPFSLKGKLYLAKKLSLLKVKNAIKGNMILYRIAKLVLSKLNN